MERTKSRDGTEIAFDRVGRGPPVILVGGAFSWRKWKGFVELADLLSARFAVLNYDRRGRGDSGDTQPYSLEREFEDLQAMVSIAGGSAFAWGLSLGRHPRARGRPRRRGDRAYRRLRASLHRRFERRPSAGRLRRAGRLAGGSRSHIRGREVLHGPGDGNPVRDPVVDEPVAAAVGQAEGDRAHAAVRGRPHRRYVRGQPVEEAYWAHDATPTLIVSGEKSPEKLRKGAAAIATALPNAELSVLSGVSHNVKMSALAPVLVDFFARRDVQRRQPGRR